MTTATQTPVDERLDTSDLDLLDEDKLHTYCTRCYPAIKPLDVVKAACGAEVLVLSGRTTPTTRCLPCHLALLAQFCMRCRRSRW